MSEPIPSWTYPFLRTLLQVIRKRDNFGYGHCRRVARWSKLLAAASGCSEYEQALAEAAGLFHDLGELGVPDEILFKPGELSPEQEAVMREHAEKSAQIFTQLSHIQFFADLMPIILHHHERIDGAGYPDGLRGDKIPKLSKIVLVADSFDAITANRPHRPERSVQDGYDELRKFAGRQFDPQIVDLFLKNHPTWGDGADEINRELGEMPVRRVA